MMSTHLTQQLAIVQRQKKFQLHVIVRFHFKSEVHLPLSGDYPLVDGKEEINQLLHLCKHMAKQ